MTAGHPANRRRPLALRIAAFFLFVVNLLRALVAANLQLARTILFERSEDLAPGFLTYPVEGLSKLEIFVLSHCITLTPGTTSVDISADFKRLTVHALDARSPEATLDGIRRDFEIPILRWTR